MTDHVLITHQFSPPIEADLEGDFSLQQLSGPAEFSGLDAAAREKVTILATMGWAPANVIDALPNLKLISSFGVGYDGVAAEHAAKKGVVVAHTPDVLNDEVANSAIILLLATKRRIVAQDRYVREGRWEKEGNAPLTRGIAGKKIGIIGLGRIGQTIAEKLAVFGSEVVYHSRSKKADQPYTYYPDLVEMAKDCDSLIVITPGGPETDKLVNRQVIDALGPEGTLVNVARGSVVDEAAMVLALQEGRLGGAGLDVFENEPSVPAPLLEMDNVVLTPHIGSATHETREAMARRVTDNIHAFFEKGAPINPVPECVALCS